jgi:hypothetical protein
MVVVTVLVLGIAGLIFIVARLTSPHEPIYEGKTLSEWIAPFCRQTAKGLDAPEGPEHLEELEPTRRAVRQMGTNALPFLIARLNHRESGLHREARQFLEKQPCGSLRLTDPDVLKIRAIRALANLGPAAEPAIPSLTIQLTDAILSQHAVYALSGMGAGGMRAFVEQYTNVSAGVRFQIATRIIDPGYRWEGPVTFMSISRNFVSSRNEANQIQTNEIPAEILIEGFSMIAKERWSPYQMPAIERLGLYGLLASNAVPVLLQIVHNSYSLVRQVAIRALGQINSEPEVVVPELNNLLNDPDPGTQTAAASALRAFGYDVTIPWEAQQVPRVIHPPPPVRPKVRYF